MLRGLVAALLLANLLFFGWARGWLAPAFPPPHQGEREPERMALQVHPEAVKVLPPQAASAAVSAARAAAAVCLEAGPLTAAELPAAEAALTPAQLPEGALLRELAAPPPLWLLYLPRAADTAQRRAREDELRKAGLPFDVLSAASAPAELAGALALSRHGTRAEADAAQAAQAASAPALRALRVAELPAPPPRTWLRVPQADADQQARLRALPASAALAGGFRPCAARP
jgi:hypothetical protein